MTNEELSNYELIELFKRLCMYATPIDKDHILELQEEIYSRMEG